MSGPLIAIVGSVHPSREAESASRTMPLKNIPLAKTAAESLGGALAQKGCRILVYSSDATRKGKEAFFHEHQRVGLLRRSAYEGLSLICF
jgi:hypothetical protein